MATLTADWCLCFAPLRQRAHLLDPRALLLAPAPPHLRCNTLRVVRRHPVARVVRKLSIYSYFAALASSWSGGGGDTVGWLRRSSCRWRVVSPLPVPSSPSSCFASVLRPSGEASGTVRAYRGEGTGRGAAILACAARRRVHVEGGFLGQVARRGGHRRGVRSWSALRTAGSPGQVATRVVY